MVVELLLNGSPWYDPNGGQDRMCRKTILRQLLNSGYAPLSPEVKTQLMEEASAEDAGMIPDMPMPARTVASTGEVVETAPAAVEAHQETAESESGMVTPPKAEKAAEQPQKAQNEGMDYAATFFGE